MTLPSMDEHKNGLIRIVAVVFHLFFFVRTVFGQQPAIDKIVAVVGNEMISLSELNTQVQFFALQNRIDPNTPGLQKQVLEAMINDKLILAKAIEDSVVATDEEVNQQLDERIKDLIQRYGSEQRVAEVYGMAINRMRREFRDEMKKEILKQKLQRLKFGTITASRRDIEEFFASYQDSLPQVSEEVEVSHIFRLPKVSVEMKNRTYAKAKAILDSIKAGADFAALAKKYSEDPGSASHGGDLGWARRGDFVKEFEEAAFALSENQMSGIVESPFGYHIIQLLERRGEAIHARQILFRMEHSQVDDDSTIVFLKEIKRQAIEGEDFRALAKKYSEDEESTPMGGDLGTLTVEQLSPEFLATVGKLKPGEISNPERVNYGKAGKSYGYHIVLLKKRTPTHKMNLTEDWKRVEQYATVFKRNREYAKWLEELRQNIYWDARL